MRRRFGAIIVATTGLVWLLAACGHGMSGADAGSEHESPASTQGTPSRILFIGNSFTYYNNGIDQHLLAMVREFYPSRTFYIDSLVRPSETLQSHFENPATLARLDKGAWDFVILQGASYEPAESASLESFMLHADLLVRMVRDHAAEPLLFMTWPYRSRPKMIQPLAEGYMSAGRETGTEVVPVGLAWEHVRASRSVTFLYSDNRHPSLHGTYLAACVFFAVLFGESPERLTYNAGLPAADARYLQEIAWRTVRQSRRPSVSDDLSSGVGAQTVAP